MRGGTHFGDAGDALFGAFASTSQPTNQPTSQPAPTPQGQRGEYRGWSAVFQGFVVDDYNDELSVFTSEEAARKWAAGK